MNAVTRQHAGHWSDARRISPAPQDDHLDPAPNARALFAVLAGYLAIMACVVSLVVKFI